MLGHDLAAALPELRAHAESRMGAPVGSTAHVWRKSGEMVKDSDGYNVPEWVIELADIPCRIGSDRGGSTSRTVSTPGGDLTLGVRTAHFPASTEGLADGDVVEVIAGRLVGSLWTIVDSDDADQQTARRASVIAAERPSGLGL